MHVWILFISPTPLSQNSVIEKHLPTTIKYIQIELQRVPKIGVARCFKTRLFQGCLAHKLVFLSIYQYLHIHSLSLSLLMNHFLILQFIHFGRTIGNGELNHLTISLTNHCLVKPIKPLS